MKSIVLLLLVGCQQPPPTAATFLDRLAKLVCPTIAGPCKKAGYPFTTAECTAAVKQYVVDPNGTFEIAQAEDCLNTSTEDLVGAAGLRPSCGYVFQPPERPVAPYHSVPAGGSCDYGGASVCQPGTGGGYALCFSTSPSNSHQPLEFSCFPINYLEVGQACDKGNNRCHPETGYCDGTTCQALGKVGDPCDPIGDINFNSECAADLHCAQNHCISGVNEGQACQTNFECDASLYCNGSCTPKTPIGEPCVNGATPSFCVGQDDIPGPPAHCSAITSRCQAGFPLINGMYCVNQGYD